MPQNLSEIAFFIVTGTVLVLLMSGFIVFMVLLHRNRQIRNRQYLQEVKQNYERTILTSQVEIQEQTLEYVGRELHDNLGQVLSLIKLSLKNPDAEQLAQTRQLVSTAISDLRSLSKSLNTDWANHLPLDTFIQSELAKINRTGAITTIYSGEKNIDLPAPQQKIIVFRLFQECLNNVLKHANATLIEVNLHQKENKYCLEIADNGNGFDKHIIQKGSGFQNMHKRSEMIGAELTIKSALNAGTKIIFHIPFQK